MRKVCFYAQIDASRFSAWSSGLSLVIVLIGLFGCSKERVDPNRTTVAGSVSFKGTPLPAGTISFESSEKNIATSAPIKDGAYSTDRAPTGSVAIGIDTASIKYGNPAKFVPIPAKYADSGTSALTAEIKPGANENVNFDLKP